MVKKTFVLVFQLFLVKAVSKKITVLDLNEKEQAMFDASVGSARETNAKLAEALK